MATIKSLEVGEEWVAVSAVTTCNRVRLVESFDSRSLPESRLPWFARFKNNLRLVIRLLRFGIASMQSERVAPADYLVAAPEIGGDVHAMRGGKPFTWGGYGSRTPIHAGSPLCHVRVLEGKAKFSQIED